SLRTLASLQAAMARLGGNSFVITAGQGSWQLETRPGVVMDGAAAEHVREGIPALGAYCDALGIRAFAAGRDLASDLADTTFNAMASLTDKPLINLESAVNHPCQALADWKTLDDLAVPRAGRFVLSWAYHPRALPLAVPAAALHMASLRGMEVIVLRPEGFALPAAIMERARRAVGPHGGVQDLGREGGEGGVCRPAGGTEAGGADRDPAPLRRAGGAGTRRRAAAHRAGGSARCADAPGGRAAHHRPALDRGE